MFETVLVAHRAAPALRVVRTLQRLGVKAVTVHSEADTGALHVAAADESVLLGPAAPRDSYLDVRRVVEAARRTGAQAVHPGCGALAEDAGFARAVVEAGLAWVGPDPAQVGRSRARRGVLGVQVLGLPDGRVVVVGEHHVRDSGVSALDESAPSDPGARATAAEVAGAAGVVGACTVELDGGEVCRLVPRLQAGHTVTELVQGVDLVEQQLLVAAGEPLTWSPGAADGVALAARVYAVDPTTDAPAAGRITAWSAPPGVRVDAGYGPGGDVPPHYDPLLAVVTVLGEDREQALARLRDAVDAFEVRGVPTNLPLLSAALTDALERTPA